MVGVSTISYFWYGTKPAISYTSSSPVIQSDSFETFPTVNTFFTVTNPSTMAGTETGWQRTNVRARTGTYSICNQDIGDVAGQSQEARIDISFTIPAYAKNIQINYYYFQDCEQGFDGLKVYLDGSLVHNYITSGSYGVWTPGAITTSVTGARKLTFEYFKDGKTSTGSDSVYVDDLSVSYIYDNITETPGTELIRFDNTGPYRLMYHFVNAQSPPISFVEQRVPFQPGSMYQYTDIQPRDIEMGIMVEGSSPSDLRSKIRTLTNKLINVDGVLYCRYSDGSERRLYCRYKEGLEGETSSKTMGVGFYQKLILTFRAFDPFWYSVDFRSEGTENFMRYTNDGSYEAYPIIIVGPCSAPDIAVWKTGTEEPAEGSISRLKINYTVPTGRKLIIDMRKRTVKLDDGTNVYSSIDSIANKFQSIPNDSTNYNIDVDIAGAESNGRYHVYIEKPHWGV